jgi:ABC-type nickel/cobalt efflux system permease component RcnA
MLTLFSARRTSQTRLSHHQHHHDHERAKEFLRQHRQHELSVTLGKDGPWQWWTRATGTVGLRLCSGPIKQINIAATVILN